MQAFCLSIILLNPKPIICFLELSLSAMHRLFGSEVMTPMPFQVDS